MSTHRWITGYQSGESLAKSSSLIFLFFKGGNRGSESRSPTSQLLHPNPQKPHAQTGVFCCICPSFSKSHVSSGLFIWKELLFSPLWEVLIWPWLSGAFGESSYFLAKQLLIFVEHPRSRSCSRPDCCPQGQRGHINVQPMQWLSADYVLSGLPTRLASLLSFRCPLVISWLINSSL